MSKKEDNNTREYIETKMLSDYGYFRLGNNIFNLKTFKNIEENFLLESPKTTALLKKKLKFEPDRIPILIDLPPRPNDSISIEEVDLSLAEVAGSLSAIRTFKGKDSVVVGITYLGSYSKRWFNQLVIEESVTDDDKHKWMLEARGKEKVIKLDENPSIVYLTSKELMDDYLIKSYESKDKYSLSFGNLNISFSKDTSISKATPDTEVNRKDLHALIGFSKFYYLYAATRDSATPKIRLIDKPLEPYSDIDGLNSIEKIILIDRIKSFT
jgi:hypothetical protein